jgi:hypothetical protein
VSVTVSDCVPLENVGVAWLSTPGPSIVRLCADGPLFVTLKVYVPGLRFVPPATSIEKSASSRRPACRSRRRRWTIRRRPPEWASSCCSRSRPHRPRGRM